MKVSSKRAGTTEPKDQKYCFQQAMRIGFQAVLCSPEFLFLQEEPEELSDYALASRLSYFLWDSLPDEEWMTLAGQQKLRQPEAGWKTASVSIVSET